MQAVRLKLANEDGTTSRVWAISSNEQHAANMIAEGELEESGRWENIAMAYKGQLRAVRARNLKIVANLTEHNADMRAYNEALKNKRGPFGRLVLWLKKVFKRRPVK